MRIKYDVKFNRLYPRRIRLDVYTVYCNARTATYNLYALGTTAPRQSEELTDIIKILHSLVYYKYKTLPGSRRGKAPRVLHYRYRGGVYA